MVNLKLQLPDHFLEEEVRCGYTVSKEMKKVWAVELDLLYEFQRVCKKYGLQYYATDGTMLGAVRHAGIIPWDDDIDVMMLREQYEILCTHKDEFQYPFFFQDSETDVGYYAGHAKLRNSLTTAIQTRTLPRGREYNQGIFIDIFPIDRMPDDKVLRRRQAKRIKRYKRWTRKIYYAISSPATSFPRRVRKILYTIMDSLYSHKRLFKKFEKACIQYNNTPTERSAKLSLNSEHYRLSQPNSDFNSFIMMDFEMLQVPVFTNYDAWLTNRYGDYKTPDTNGNYHGDMIFDPDVPYDIYIKTHHELFEV